jgi:hypothetical protein
VVSRTPQRAGAHDRASGDSAPCADPRCRLRQRAQHGRAGAPGGGDRRGDLTHQRRARPRPSRRRGGGGLGDGDAVRRRFLRPRGVPRRDRAPARRPWRVARAAARAGARWSAAGDGARLPVAVERPRQGQPPLPALLRRRSSRPPAPPVGSASTPPTSTRCCCRSRSPCAHWSACTAARPNRASTCGCRRHRSTGCCNDRWSWRPRRSGAGVESRWGSRCWQSCARRWRGRKTEAGCHALPRTRTIPRKIPLATWPAPCERSKHGWR